MATFNLYQTLSTKSQTSIVCEVPLDDGTWRIRQRSFSMRRTFLVLTFPSTNKAKHVVG